MQLQNIQLTGRLVSVTIKSVTRKVDNKEFTFSTAFVLTPDGEVTSFSLSDKIDVKAVKTLVNQDVIVTLNLGQNNGKTYLSVVKIELQRPH